MPNEKVGQSDTEIDTLGKTSPELLFELSSQRYERKSARTTSRGWTKAWIPNDLCSAEPTRKNYSHASTLEHRSRPGQNRTAASSRKLQASPGAGQLISFPHPR
ncbi:hypothetical protein DSM110093_03699 (plasmid) [Sulfitobacter sp. DSM 110093]|nr:hypothetical protein DSM110093_03699 [Sulfitobacter sp. DSM 110093]